MLKTFQWVGYFVQPDDVPPIIVAHIAATAGLDYAVAEFDAYDAASSYRSRLMTLVREYGVRTRAVRNHTLRANEN